MGDMRKDYVLERAVIVHPTTKKNTNTKKCPYCPGNESMTNPSLLSLVAKDGMLRRLQDSEDFFVDDWSVRVFESKEPTVSISTKNSYSDRPLYSEPAYGYHYIVVVSPKHKDTLATISTDQLSTKKSSLSCNLCNIPSFSTSDNNDGLVMDSLPGQYGHFLVSVFFFVVG